MKYRVLPNLMEVLKKYDYNLYDYEELLIGRVFNYHSSRTELYRNDWWGNRQNKESVLVGWINLEPYSFGKNFYAIPREALEEI